MAKRIKLDKEEQALEDQFDSLQSDPNKEHFTKALEAAAIQHVQNKKPITIRVSIADIEAIKIKASRCGIPYQTYINMLIHKDAINL